MRRALLALALVAAAVLAAAFLARERLLDLAVERFARRVLAEPEMLRDGKLHLVLCGTAGPVADTRQRSACNAVVVDGEMLLVDVGDGGTTLASGLGLPLRQLSSVLVTHLHHDHVGGLGDVIHGSWFVGRTRPVTVYGPPGVEALVRGVELAFAEDRRVRQLSGGGGLDPRWARPEVRVVEVEGDLAAPVLERGRIRVSAFAVDHGPIEPAYGYRVAVGDRALVFAGDGRADERLAGHALGADVLVQATVGFQFLVDEARIARVMAASGRDLPDPMRVLSLFSSPVEIAQLAERAGVETLVFSHHPPMPRWLEPVFLWGVSGSYSGSVHVGREGMHFELAVR